MASSSVLAAALAACLLSAVAAVPVHEATVEGAKVVGDAACTLDPVPWPIPKHDSELTDFTPIDGYNGYQTSLAYLVSIQVAPLWKKPQHFCSGALIGREWVLTSARCIKAVPWLSSVHVLAGKSNFSATETGEQRAEVKKMIVHPKYKGGLSPNDIGLLQLKTPIANSGVVEAAALPSNASLPGYGMIGGWRVNDNSYENAISSRMHWLGISTISESKCYRFFSELAQWGHDYTSALSSSVFCVGDLSSANKGVELADAGAPLADFLPILNSSSPIVFGIASWGFFPCDKASPFVFTDVYPHVDWIENTIAKNS